MRSTRIWLMALVLAASFSGVGCLLIPEITDKIVQLALTGSTSGVFNANGPETNPLDLVSIVSIGEGTDLDLRQILEDAGMDVSDVEDVKVQKVEYAITQADPVSSRTVQDKLTVEWQGTQQDLIVGFSANVGAVTGYQAASLQTTGVDLLNQALASVLAQLQQGLNPTETVTFHVTGTTTPNTDPNRNIAFQYSIKLTVSMVGTVSVSVPS